MRISPEGSFMHTHLPTRKHSGKRHGLRPETTLQIAVVRYLRYTLPKSWFVHHSPNEEATRLIATLQKRMGTVTGWPDVQIIGQRDIGFPGREIVPWSWFIELKIPADKDLKRRRGTLTEEQEECHAALLDLGYPVGTATSIDEVRELVREWGLPSTDVELTMRN